MPYTIVRPTGFFSDLTALLHMAEKGRVYVIGSGEHTLNPVHGEDVADICVQAAEQGMREAAVGGPRVYLF